MSQTGDHRKGRHTGPLGKFACYPSGSRAVTVADLYASTRSLARTPRFTATAIITLTVGIASVTAVYSLLYRAVLGPLPYPDASRLVVVAQGVAGLGVSQEGLSTGLFHHFGDNATGLESLGGYNEAVMNLATSPTEHERIGVALATPELLRILGAAPVAGRLYGLEDDEGGFMNMRWPIPILIRHDLWQSAFGGSQDIVGSLVRLDGRERRVVGVLPESFTFPHRDVQAWLMFVPPRETARLRDSGGSTFVAVARLRPEVGVDELRAELARLLPSAVGQFRDATAERLGQLQLTPLVLPLKMELIGDTGDSLWLVFGAVALLLLAACANAAGLFLSRVSDRRHELALRRALGAGQVRVTGLLLAEAGIVTTAAAALGAGSAWLGLKGLSHGGLTSVLGAFVLGSGEAAGFLTGATGSAAAALLCAGLPGLSQARSPGARPALAGTHSLPGLDSGNLRVRKAFIAVQLAFAVALLSGSVLLAQSLWRLHAVPLGFEPHEVLVAQVSLSRGRAESGHRIFPALAERLEAISAIRDVAATTDVPLDGRSRSYTFPVARTRRGDEAIPQAQIAGVEYFTPGLTSVLGISTLQGSAEIASADRVGSRPVLVNETLARRLFGDAEVVGQGLERRERDGTVPVIYDQATNSLEPVPPYTVVGVVADVRDVSPRSAPTPVLYIPILDPPLDPVIAPTDMHFVIRAAGGVSLTESVRTAIAELREPMSLGRLELLETIIRRRTASDRFVVAVLMGSAMLATLLGAVGIFGVVGRLARRQRREAAIRMMLGARSGQVVRSMLGSVAVYGVAGVVGGGLVAVLGSRLLENQFFGARAADSLALVLGAVFLLCVAAAAAWLPARRVVKDAALADLARSL